jgi:RNA polymerase sigma factor (sigma-70 family)
MIRPNACRSAFVDTARRLAASEIAYIGHPAFSQPKAEQWLAAQRPPERQTPARLSPSAGVAFIPGLVAAPLLSPAEERYQFLSMNFLRYQAERLRRKIDPRRPARGVVTEVQRLLAEAVGMRNRIAEANVRLIVATARSLSSSVDQMSDLIGEGMLPLLRAVELFDVDRGHKFSTYATWAVRNQMLRFLRRERRHTELRRGDFDNTIAECRTDDEPPASTASLTKLLLMLSDRERRIIHHRYGLHGQPAGQSLADIGRQVGLSKERVRQLAATALDKMRQESGRKSSESI